MNDVTNQRIRGGLPVTAQQAAVIDHMLQNALTVVGAGAGSGKTHTTIAAIMTLLEQRLCDLDQFVLITFTNKAADELRARLDRILLARCRSETGGANEQFWRSQQEKQAAAYVGTIHGFCSQILRTFGYDARVAREADVTFARHMLTEALEDAVEAAVRSDGQLLMSREMTWHEHNLRDLIDQILQYMHNRGISPATVLDATESQPADDGKPFRVALARTVADADEIYARNKSAEQRLDANDLLARTVELLSGQSGPTVATQLSRRYRYLLVDEFQDTDRIQKEIFDLLLPYFAGLLVVGDRKQSIYAFRAADVSLLQEIAVENQVPVLPLSVSRRPTRRLLDLENALFRAIARDFPELGDPLEPYEGTIQGSETLDSLVLDEVNVMDGTDAVAGHIRELLTGSITDTPTGSPRPIEPGDIVILVRSNLHLDHYELRLSEALREDNIQVRRETGGSFYTSPEIVSTYRMVRLLLQFPDDATLSMAFRTPYLRGVDASVQERSVLQYLYGAHSGTPLTDWFDDTYPNLAENLKILRSSLRSDTVPQLLAKLYESFEIRTYYLGLNDLQAIENLEKLRELARGLFREEQALTLRQFADWMKLGYMTRREESLPVLELEDAEKRPPYIRVMTIHRAKGLEFPIVVLPEIQRPLQNPEFQDRFLVIDGYGLDVDLSEYGAQTASSRFALELQQSARGRTDEEMRLFYVAVTRAQHAAILIGKAHNGRYPPNAPGTRYYSWRDAVLAAWPQVAGLPGARRISSG